MVMAVFVMLGLALTVDLIRQAVASDRVDWQPVSVLKDHPSPSSQPVIANLEGAAPQPLNLLRFTSKSCGPCRMMDVKVFSREDVARAIHRLTQPLSLDLSRPTPADLAWTQRYGVVSTPTLLLLDHAGQEVACLERAVDARTFQNWLEAQRRGPLR